MKKVNSVLDKFLVVNEIKNIVVGTVGAEDLVKILEVLLTLCFSVFYVDFGVTGGEPFDVGGGSEFMFISEVVSVVHVSDQGSVFDLSPHVHFEKSLKFIDSVLFTIHFSC